MQTIILREHGVLPDTDCTLALYELTEKYKSDTTFVFEEADYYFDSRLEYPYNLSNTEPMPTRFLAIWLKNAKNVHLEGNGARLWFSGQIQPITFDHCDDCSAENFVIDWKKPLVAEGIVCGFTESSVDLFVDPQKYPHRLADNGKLEFDTGNGEWYPIHLCSSIQFDSNTRTVRRNSGDNFAPAFPIEKIGDNTYRLNNRQTEEKFDTAIGNVFVLRHNERVHAGIFAEKSCNITVSDITIHSCGGLGCLAQFCRDMTYRRVNFVPNEKAGRIVSSGRDDGMHITCCSGEITITECSFLGLMDDPINVHSCCVVAEEIVDKYTLRCRFKHYQASGFDYWAECGDTISFIERDSMATFASAVAESYTVESRELFLIRFKDELPAEVLSTDCSKLSLDNLSHTASFTCTNNRFGSCRARGILVSTPQRVRISRNLFESSGSAILVAGDSNFWFESGECHDVEISDNIFTKTCRSSMYQFTEGIISVCPVVPKPNTDSPYHKNIVIRNNVFDTPNTPVLYAYSTKHVEFSGNQIFRAYTGSDFAKPDGLILLKYCSDVSIGDNAVIGELDFPLVAEENCRDITCG